jgi:hypothetical protein
MEEWKVCFERYEISNIGNLRKKLLNGSYKVVKGSTLKAGSGYRYFQTTRGGIRTNRLFHHLVAEQFIGARPDGLVIDHIDRDTLNNRVENLRYITQKENCANQDRYIEEVKETDCRLRGNILSVRRGRINKANAVYICETCPRITPCDGNFVSKYKYERHMISKRHLDRICTINEMERLNITVNAKSFRSIKNQNYDYRRGRRSSPPEIILA